MSDIQHYYPEPSINNSSELTEPLYTPTENYISTLLVYGSEMLKTVEHLTTFPPFVLPTVTAEELAQYADPVIPVTSEQTPYQDVIDFLKHYFF